MSREDDYGNNIVKFYTKPVVDRAASEAAGKTVFGEVECVHILPGHTKKLEIMREVTDKDRAIYAPRYEAWKRAEAEGRSLDGTPLEVFPAVERHDIIVLKAHKPPIRTVEELAGLSAAACPTPGIQLLREKAIAFVENGSAALLSETIARLKSVNTEQSAQLAELTAQLADVSAQLKAATAEDTVKLAPKATAPAPQKHRGRA